MTASTPAASSQDSFPRLIDAFIRVGLVFLLASWCFEIVRPFVLPVLWAVVLAVALYPAFHRFEQVLGGRKKIAAGLFAILGIALIVVPTYLFFASLIEGSAAVVKEMNAGTLEIPPPDASVKEWPFVGEKIHAQWLAVSTDVEGTLQRFGPQIRTLVAGAAGTVASLGMDAVLFIISIFIAATFLATARTGSGAFTDICIRLVGERGPEFAQLTTDTIRNVAKGVVGVAIIQTALCGIGILAAGIPAAGLWILLILILAVIQMPTILILLPLIIYQFSVAGTVPAVIFAVWSMIAGGSDTFLKPMFLGRGMKTPMLVILIGAIGGMMFAGILGLFLGAVALSLGHELFRAWLDADRGDAATGKA